MISTTVVPVSQPFFLLFGPLHSSPDFALLLFFFSRCLFCAYTTSPSPARRHAGYGFSSSHNCFLLWSVQIGFSPNNCRKVESIIKNNRRAGPTHPDRPIPDLLCSITALSETSRGVSDRGLIELVANNKSSICEPRWTTLLGL
ncbi:hypothetical protein BDD12DRAFT_91965 [Trichophaea hybrida]|nr:hypothetical protein BDD12DRAFT_91965 [Trichophaea hybrida]